MSNENNVIKIMTRKMYTNYRTKKAGTIYSDRKKNDLTK